MNEENPNKTHELINKSNQLKPDPIRLIQWKIKERENNQNQLERSEEKQSKNNKEKKNQT